MKTLLVILISIFSMRGFAQETAILGGLNFADGEITVGTTELALDSETGFQGGVRYLHELQNLVVFRTGAEIAQSQTAFSILGSTGEFSVLYLHVPLTVQYMFSEQFGFFGGLGANIVISDDCTIGGNSCGANVEVNKFMADFQIGAVARFSDFMGAEAYYRHAISDIADNTQVNVIGLQLLFYM